MRVLLVVKGLDIGGIERSVVDLTAGLRRAGVDAEVAIVNGARDGFLPALRATGAPAHLLGGTDRIGAHAARRLARLLRDERYDVVHVHGPLPTILARLVPGRRPLVSTSHTPWGGLRLPVRVLWWLTRNLDDAHLAVSEAVAGSLPRLRRGSQVVAHGVDDVAIEHARRPPASTVGPPGPIALVTIASHREVKNYPNLLSALRRSIDGGADAHLIAVGEGPRLQEHRRLTSELGLDGRVEFRPPTPEGLEAIAGADVLVVASDFEGQPLVVSEALALGRPVIATAVGRVPDLVDDSVGRVVPPGDPDALARAIIELCGDADLRLHLGAAAARSPSRRPLEAVVADHVAVYEGIRRV